MKKKGGKAYGLEWKKLNPPNQRQIDNFLLKQKEKNIQNFSS